MQNYKLSLWSTSILLIISLTTIFAQSPQDNSPYSRYGLGNLLTTDFPVVQSMGGLSATYNNPFHINFTNPASIAFLQYTALEVGVFSEYSRLTDNSNNSFDNVTGNLTHMALGFPLKNQLNKATEENPSPFDFAMAFGAMPHSTVAYELESTGTLPNIGDVRYGYRGRGGLYQISWANAMKYKNFAFGLNLGYLFGVTRNERTVALDDVENSFSNVFIDELSTNGFVWRAGAQYETIFGLEGEDDIKGKLNNTRMIVGLYGNSANTVDVTGTSIISRINTAYSSNLDTVIASQDIQAESRLPMELGFGVMFLRPAKWRLGINYSMGNWSEYTNPLKQDELANSWELAIGGEYTPDIRSLKYSKVIRYRFGFHYGKDPRVIDNEQLTEYGINFGFGLPLKLPRGLPSFVDLAFEVGQFGTSSLINETYFRLNVGFTLNDNTWFYKQKFN